VRACVRVCEAVSMCAYREHILKKTHSTYRVCEGASMRACMRPRKHEGARMRACMRPRKLTSSCVNAARAHSCAHVCLLCLV
jgi:hypothetical protein